MQAIFANNALPCAIAASFRLGGVPRLTTVFAAPFVSAKRGENDLTYSTTAQRSSSLRICFQGGIGVPGIPKETDRNRSTSVGSSPPAVERSRNFASTKLRGFGSRKAAASPLPSRLIPWQ